MSSESYWKGPLTSEPDFANVLAALRCEVPSRPTLCELFMNDPLHRRVLTDDQIRTVESSGISQFNLLNVFGYLNMGYDYATVRACDFAFTAGERKRDKTLSLNDGVVVTDRRGFDPEGAVVRLIKGNNHGPAVHSGTK